MNNHRCLPLLAGVLTLMNLASAHAAPRATNHSGSAPRCAALFVSESEVIEQLASLRIEADRAYDNGDASLAGILYSLFKERYADAHVIGIDPARIATRVDELRDQSAKLTNQERTREERAERSEGELIHAWAKHVSLTGETPFAHGFAALHDGRHALVTAADKILKVDLSSGQRVAEIKTQLKPVREFTLSPDDHYAYGRDEDGRSAIWDVSTGRKLFDLAKTKNAGRHSSVAFSPDGSYLISNTWRPKQVLSVWNMKTGKIIRRIPDVLFSGELHTFNVDGSLFATRQNDQVVVYETRTGKEAFRVRGDDGGFSADGKSLVSQGHYVIKSWDATTGAPIAEVERSYNSPYEPIISPDGRKVAFEAGDSQYEVWSLLTGKRISALPKGFGSIQEVVFTPDSTRLLVSSNDPAFLAGIGNPIVTMIDVTTGFPIQVLAKMQEPTNGFKFSPDGSWLLMHKPSAQGHTLMVWANRSTQR